MIDYVNTPLFGVGLTIIVFSIFNYLSKKIKLSLFNPIALSIISIIYILRYNNIDYELYNRGGSIISFFLGPATVVLAVPLYRRIKLLKDNFFPIMVGILAGSVTGIISVIFFCKFFKLDRLITLSMIPKSTTSAIAVDISRAIGGNPAITIALVTATGILGNIVGPLIFRIFRIDNQLAKGISLGTASHVVGTAKAMEIGETVGAMSSLAIGLAGLVTVFLAPLILKIINI